MATLIEGRSSYKRVLCLGHILDGDGQKMSKSKGNVVEPDDILDHQGADAFRWFMFASQQPWSPRRFGAEMVDEVVRKFLLTLWNTYSFFTLYANIDRFDPTAQESPLEERPLLDRWLVGELNTLVQDVTAGLEAYDATGTAAPSSSSSTTSATGTCAAAGVASGRARATPTSWPPTTRCTRRSSR